MRRPYMVTAYYGPGGRKGGKGRVGEREGDLAIEVACGDEGTRQLEVDILKKREDVGVVSLWISERP